MAGILLTGLNFFKIEGSLDTYEPTLTDLNGNYFSQVIIKVDANSSNPGTDIVLPDFGGNVPLNVKLVIALDTLNVDGVSIDPGFGKVNGRNSISFSNNAEPGSSITLVPVGDQNWSALVGEYVD